MKLSKLPWWLKIAIKSVIDVLPVSYERVRKIVTGYGGEMTSLKYAEEIFEKFIVDYESIEPSTYRGTLLELGPGGSLIGGVIGRGLGFERCILVDVGDFASRDPALYRPLVDKLPPETREVYLNALEKTGDVVESFRQIGIDYRSMGLESLRDIPDSTVTFSFSNAVLEHVNVSQFAATVEELNRIHCPDSISSHQVDYKDHLDRSLHNLRFPRSFWEHRLFPNSGFYTNRMRHSDVRRAFVDGGFTVERESMVRWDELPLSRSSMAVEFQGYSDEDLLISGARLVCRKNQAGNGE